MGLSRRSFLKTSALAGTAGVLSAGRPASGDENAAHPNFLIVVCDQMVVDAISAHRQHFRHPAYLCHWVETPYLDEMVRNGVSFMESHSANPVCSPARSCLFTGRMPVETGLIENNVGIDQGIPNMGEWFEKHSDYDRVYCGKWHAGGPWNNPSVAGPRKIPGFDTLPSGPDTWGQHMDYGISSGVEAYLRNHAKDKPFLIVAGLMDPHDICFWGPGLDEGNRTRATDFFRLGDRLPVVPPNQDYGFEELFGGAVPASRFPEMSWRNYIYDYSRMIERLDRNVGRMLRAVKDRGDDTIVVFTSDHGDGLGRHRRVQKWHPYDESLRVPFVVYGPKFGIRRNVLDAEHLVSGPDLMSTVCDYAGIAAPPHMRGRALRPLLEGAKTDWRTQLYAELRMTGRVIRSQRYKYVTSYVTAPPKQRSTFESVFLDGDGKPAEFVQGEGRRFRREPLKMLFDMLDDPWETKNLVGEPKLRDVLAEHERILRDEWEADLIPGHHFTRK